MSDISDTPPSAEQPPQKTDPIQLGFLIGMPAGIGIGSALRDPIKGALIGIGISLTIAAIVAAYQWLQSR